MSVGHGEGGHPQAQEGGWSTFSLPHQQAHTPSGFRFLNAVSPALWVWKSSVGLFVV